VRTAFGTAVAAGMSLATDALADHCHPPAPFEPLGSGVRISLSVEAATYDTGHDEGDYQGVSLGVSYDHRRWLWMRALLPAYRLKRDGEELYGPGDLVTEARVMPLMSSDGVYSAGAGLVVTAPTGDASDDLGMGHFMVMPGLRGEILGEKVFVQAQVAYGRALTSSASEQGHDAHEHHDTAGLHPIVNPMNESEIAGAAGAGYRLHELVRLRAGLYGALPVAMSGGRSRGVAIAGVDLLVDPVDLGLEGQLPFAGDPFQMKARLTGGVRF